MRVASFSKGRKIDATILAAVPFLKWKSCKTTGFQSSVTFFKKMLVEKPNSKIMLQFFFREPENASRNTCRPNCRDHKVQENVSQEIDYKRKRLLGKKISHFFFSRPKVPSLFK